MLLKSTGVCSENPVKQAEKIKGFHYPQPGHGKVCIRAKWSISFLASSDQEYFYSTWMGFQLVACVAGGIVGAREIKFWRRSHRRYFRVPLPILLAASPFACRLRRKNFISPATQARILVQLRVTPTIKFARTHLYTRVGERHCAQDCQQETAVAFSDQIATHNRFLLFLLTCLQSLIETIPHPRLPSLPQQKKTQRTLQPIRVEAIFRLFSYLAQSLDLAFF